MSTKFDLISDLHVDINGPWYSVDHWSQNGCQDFYPWQERQQSDYLVIAGDMANDFRLSVEVIKQAAIHYKHVVFTDGNHDHYTSGLRRHKVDDVMERFLQLANQTSNISYLIDGQIAILGDAAFVGANGWYDWEMEEWGRERQHLWWKRESNDSKCIRFSPNGYPDKMARRSAFVLSEIMHKLQYQEDRIEAIVSVTHTAPMPRGLSDDPKWRHLNGSYYNSGMANMVGTYSKLTNWVYGHTHTIADFQYKGVWFTNNARGYPMDRPPNTERPMVQIDTSNPSAWD